MIFRGEVFPGSQMIPPTFAPTIRLIADQRILDVPRAHPTL